MKESTIENPSVFPLAPPKGTYHQSGMTLRDYFAAMAMNALIIKSNSNLDWSKQAYRLADAMLNARQETK